MLQKTQVIYIATTRNYASQNKFKIGGAKSIGRLNKKFLNCKVSSDDDWYYSDFFFIANYKQLKLRMSHLFKLFIIDKVNGIYRMHYTDIKNTVEFLCKRLNDETDLLNKIIQDEQRLNNETLN